jgi:hypothetical protein
LRLEVREVATADLGFRNSGVARSRRDRVARSADRTQPRRGCGARSFKQIIAGQGVTGFGVVAKRSVSFRNFPKLSVSFRWVPGASKARRVGGAVPAGPCCPKRGRNTAPTGLWHPHFQGNALAARELRVSGALRNVPIRSETFRNFPFRSGVFRNFPFRSVPMHRDSARFRLVPDGCSRRPESFVGAGRGPVQWQDGQADRS